jgi:RsiW-degrading membrane proteinase PrsW (M82 family)
MTFVQIQLGGAAGHLVFPGITQAHDALCLTHYYHSHLTPVQIVHTSVATVLHMSRTCSLSSTHLFVPVQDRNVAC